MDRGTDRVSEVFDVSGKRRSYGEGSIRKRGETCWEGRYSAGFDILTGKRIQKCVYGRSKRECAAKLARAIEFNTGSYYRKGPGYEDQPLEVWIRVWFETYTRPNIRPNTANGYLNAIDNHIIPALGKIKLSKLTTLQVQHFYNELREKGRLDSKKHPNGKPLSASMVKHVHLILSASLKQAVKERIIMFNPCENCKVPKPVHKEMVVLPQDRIGAYLAETKRLGLYEMFFLELTSGLRRGELIALEWNDLNVTTRMLTVNKQVYRQNGTLTVSIPKTANSNRIIALPQSTVDLLVQEHEKHPHSPLMFCYPRTESYWSPDVISRVHKKALKAAGIEERVRFHDLRHTFSTLAIQSGADVKTISSMMGHFSSAFTLDTYTHVTNQMQLAAAEKIESYISANIQIQTNIEINITSVDNRSKSSED